jgi:isocitrate dehydrogenase kinase/phosphatase
LNKSLSDSRLANICAQTILEAFISFQEQFQEITSRARRRFRDRDWRGMQQDAVERLDLYRLVLDPAVSKIHTLLDERLQEKLIWTSMKAVFSGLIADRDDWEIAETFFNSVTRRIFTTVGVDQQIEFVDTDFDTPPTQAVSPVYYTFERHATTAGLLEAILASFEFESPFWRGIEDFECAAQAIHNHLQEIGALLVVERAEVIRSVFYRGKGAYLVGRMYSGTHLIPLALALLHTPQGLEIDAVLLEENEISILFSFARSYFHVEASRPHDMVIFLRSIMPRKKIAELYIAIGYNKHGKTELYRDLLSHLAHSMDQFVIAPGERGMVMIVFTMPSYDVVFKIIRDHFGYSKNTTPQEVRGKYRLVFKHDRAGRLVDAQEFEYLKFDRRFFHPALLQELQATASKNVSLEADAVVIRHLYTERRLTPLDIYVRDASPQAARAAVIDYGQTLKDLAATNIFPGDVLLKNFGVTRHGRVVFYDYDELCLLTDCNFRSMPQSADYEEELAAEPWFFVDERDIFPAEFRTFLGLVGELRAVFESQHADLFTAEYWRKIQERLRAGEILDLYPYDARRRLRRDCG